jgi:hypothetical protein
MYKQLGLEWLRIYVNTLGNKVNGKVVYLSAFKTEQEFWSGEHYRKEETCIPFIFS